MQWRNQTLSIKMTVQKSRQNIAFLSYFLQKYPNSPILAPGPKLRPNSNIMMSTISIYQLIHDLRQVFFSVGGQISQVLSFIFFKALTFNSKSIFLYFLEHFLCISQRDVLMVKNFWFKCVVDSPLRQNQIRDSIVSFSPTSALRCFLPKSRPPMM